jgi:fibrillarin-like pre-rRNA processing protein
MKELKNEIFVEDVGKKSLFLTKNLIIGENVYGERIWQKGEYRVIEPLQSKLGALLAKTNGKVVLDVKKEDFVLYLGASTGTTVSHFSDIVGNEGGVFAVESSPRVMRDLVFLCEKRKNIAPILASANHPEEYKDTVMKVDFLYQDVSQKNQVEMFLKNVNLFLKKGSQCAIAIKAFSIDVSKKPEEVFKDCEKKLIAGGLKIIDKVILEPYHKGHCMFICKS